MSGGIVFQRDDEGYWTEEGGRVLQRSMHTRPISGARYQPSIGLLSYLRCVTFTSALARAAPDADAGIMSAALFYVCLTLCFTQNQYQCIRGYP